jgi:hypothetical protein
MEWGKVEENYERGARCSKLSAIHCIEMLQIPTVLNHHRILDVAAETSSFLFTQGSNCENITDSSILATDMSPVMVEIRSSDTSPPRMFLPKYVLLSPSP